MKKLSLWKQVKMKLTKIQEHGAYKSMKNEAYESMLKWSLHKYAKMKFTKVCKPEAYKSMQKSSLWNYAK